MTKNITKIKRRGVGRPSNLSRGIIKQSSKDKLKKNVGRPPNNNQKQSQLLTSNLKIKSDENTGKTFF